MVDYKKLKSGIIKATASIAAGIALLIAVQKLQKIHDQKSFDKLPKEQQEVIIKLRENKTPEKTIKINIHAHEELMRIAEGYQKMEELVKKGKTIPVTDINIKVQRITYASNNICVLKQLLQDLETRVIPDMTLLNQTEAEMYIDLIKGLISELKEYIEDLENMKFK